MIQEIQLSNFKAFADAVKIPIKPITLIFGANSSGKSSIFQALLMLKQTLEESVSGDQSLLPKGKLVDLGNFREFIHNHDESRLFSVTFKIAPPIDLYDAIPTEDYISQNKDDSDRMNNLGKSIKSLPLGITVSFSRDAAKGIHVTKLDLLVGDDPAPIITYVNEPPESMESLADDVDEEVKRLRAHQWRIYRKSPKSYFKFKKFAHHEYWKIYFESIKEHQYWSKWKDEFGLLSAEPQKIIATLTKEEQDCVSHLAKTNITRLFADDFLTLSKFLPVELNGCEPQYLTSDDFGGKDQDNISVLTLAVSFKINEFLSDCLIHLGPARPSPERNFFFSGNISSYVGKNGQYTSESLDTNPELVKKVNKQLSSLNLGYKVKIVPLTSDSSDIKVSTIRLISDSEIDLAITDVGYGISQVLPIIVQSILSKKKTIFIEQPELHLHPAQQAELGDLFINAALGEQKNTFIIETHSEHLILRLLRRIRETSEGKLPDGVLPITPEQISVLYVQPGSEGAKITDLRITNDGDFENRWPNGFFTERSKELF
jgi:predicted ATPase